MAINPVQFSHQVCDEYLRYLFSAFPLSDPELADQARVLLERPSSLDIPLVKGPYVSLSEPFAEGHAVADMAAKGKLHPVMPNLIGFPTVYLHQQRVFESVKQGRHVLVSTGTGSGKTEAFLYPIVDELLRERDQGVTTGLKAILIYPMNALANDQLDRLREMLAGTGITFGHLVCTVCGAAQTPYAVDKRIEQFSKIHSDRCGKPPLWLAITAEAEVDLLQFHDMTSNAAAINIGESLRTAAAQLLDMGPDDLQILIVGKAEEKSDLLIYDPMSGGSGILEQMLARWDEIVQTACTLLDRCPNQCETACYSCLKTFRNQFYHPLLNRRDALGLIADLNVAPQPYREITPVLEEDAPTQGNPSNVRESQLVRLLLEHQFPAGKCRQPVRTSVGGLTTTPDWLYEDPLNPAIKVAVYQDGMSRNLHGDPKQAQRDTLIRSALEIEGYKVIVVQSRDLDDAEAIRRHLADIAEAIGQPGLAP